MSIIYRSQVVITQFSPIYSSVHHFPSIFTKYPRGAEDAKGSEEEYQPSHSSGGMRGRCKRGGAKACVSESSGSRFGSLILQEPRCVTLDKSLPFWELWVSPP